MKSFCNQQDVTKWHKAIYVHAICVYIYVKLIQNVKTEIFQFVCKPAKKWPSQIR